MKQMLFTNGTETKPVSYFATQFPELGNLYYNHTEKKHYYMRFDKYTVGSSREVVTVDKHPFEFYFPGWSLVEAKTESVECEHDWEYPNDELRFCTKCDVLEWNDDNEWVSSIKKIEKAVSSKMETTEPEPTEPNTCGICGSKKLLPCDFITPFSEPIERQYHCKKCGAMLIKGEWISKKRQDDETELINWRIKKLRQLHPEMSRSELWDMMNEIEKQGKFGFMEIMDKEAVSSKMEPNSFAEEYFGAFADLARDAKDKTEPDRIEKLEKQVRIINAENEIKATAWRMLIADKEKLEQQVKELKSKWRETERMTGNILSGLSINKQKDDDKIVELTKQVEELEIKVSIHERWLQTGSQLRDIEQQIQKEKFAELTKRLDKIEIIKAMTGEPVIEYKTGTSTEQPEVPEPEPEYTELKIHENASHLKYVKCPREKWGGESDCNMGICECIVGCECVDTIFLASKKLRCLYKPEPPPTLKGEGCS